MCLSQDDNCLEIVVASNRYWAKKPFHPPLLPRLRKLRYLSVAQKLASAVRQLKCVNVGRTVSVLLHYSSGTEKCTCDISLAYEELSYICNDEQCHHFVLH